MRQRDSYENATCVKEEQKGSMNIQRYLIRSLLKETQWSFDFNILLEDYRLDKIQTMVNKRLPEDEQLDTEQLESIIKADPTAKDGAGKYSEWIVKQYIQSDSGYRSRFFEDLYKYTNALRRFHELKVRNKIKIKDINQIKNLWSLQEIIEGEEQESILEGFPDTRSLEANGEVEVLLRDPRIHIYWTKTHNANTILGSGTQWCTVPKGSRYFNEYNGQGPIFILYIKTESGFDRYQYHFESSQFMNEDDRANNEFLTVPSVENAFVQFALKHKNGSIAIFYKNEQLLQDPEIQLNAVRQNKSMIRHIKNPSEAVQIEAVKQDGFVIKYIKNPSEAVQIEAVKQNGYAIEYIKNPSEAVKKEAVKQNGFVIKYIKNPSEAVQIEAVRQDTSVIEYIKNPSKAVKKEANRE